nr:MAPEG family protein [Massilia sp. TS11]
MYPVFGLAALTVSILPFILRARIAASVKREVTPADFRYGESARVPGHVSLPNRNYMNLLELPVLFYVICALLYAAEAATPLLVQLAWAYVGLRAAHSLIHLSYNNVLHRLAAFAASNVVLVLLWVMAGTVLL